MIGGAAAIMIVVFAAFTISPIVPLKELGFGLAAAVFLAATAIQLLLVPAALQLLGERPRFLERALPRLAIETPARAGVPAAVDAQQRTIVVKGGYQPDRIYVAQNQPVRLLFLRRESSPCSEEVVFDHFAAHATLPEGQPVELTLPASGPGEYEFTCGRRVLRGTLVIQ